MTTEAPVFRSKAYTPRAVLAIKAMKHEITAGWPTDKSTIKPTARYAAIFREEMGRDASMHEISNFTGVDARYSDYA